VRKRLSSLIVILIGGGLLVWFVRRLDWQVVGEHFRTMKVWPIVVAALLTNLTLFWRSLRWRVLLAPIAPASLANLFSSTTIGFGSVFVIGRAGEIVRPMVLSLKEKLHPSVTFATILVERVFDMTTVGLLFAVNLLFFQFPPQSTADESTLATMHRVGLLMTVTSFVGIALLVIFRLRTASVVSILERLLKPLPVRLRKPVIGFVENLSLGLSVLLDVGELLRAVFFTILVWASGTMSAWLVFFAFNLNLSLSAAVFVMGFGLIGSLVPSPGGSAGAFHAAAAAGLIVLGVEKNLAGSVAIAFHFVAFGPPFLLGLFYVAKDGIGLGSLREMISVPETVTAGNSSSLPRAD
jgi:glycosyltransferase 2 family protein